MQVTAVWLVRSWLPVWFGAREWLFGPNAIPSNVVAKSATEMAAQSSFIVSKVASFMGTVGMKWEEMSLNDVCCLLPAWFGAWATLITGLLALECSADFIGYGKGNRFGTVLDKFPLIGYYLQRITTPIRKMLVYYSGLDVSPSHSRSTTCLQTTSLLSMLATMYFMGIVPAHIMRSVGGGYDNESVAMTAMILVFYLWTRSLRGCESVVVVDDKKSNVDMHIRQKQDVGFEVSSSTMTALLWGSVTGVAYFYMVASWGGYVFVINLVGAHCATLILLGRHSSKLHAAYSAFYFVGTLLATRVLVVGTTPLRSLEQLGPLLVFLGIQIVEYCERVRTRDNLTRSKVWLLRLRFASMAAVVLLGVGMALWPTGYFGPISSRVRGLFVKHTKTGNPLVDSVAEHQAAKAGTYEQYLKVVAKIAPIGFGMVAIGFANDASSFLLVYGLAAYFFSHKMVRLILLTAPIASVLAGLLVGRVAGFCVEGICGWRLDAGEVVDTIFGRLGDEPVVAAAVTVVQDNPSKKAKKKKSDIKETEEEDTSSTEAASSLRRNVLFQISTRIAWLYLAFHLYTRAQPELSSFKHHCQQMAISMSHPTILVKAQTNDGHVVLVDDYREAYWWLRDNTPEDSRIMAWWDYGYQITAIANRTTIADGNTWNHEHIALLGRALTSPLKEGHRIARHLADYVLLWTGGGGDDLAKSPHLARIANSVYRQMVSLSWIMVVQEMHYLRKVLTVLPFSVLGTPRVASSVLQGVIPQR
jgi:dolichyl-diphosphooligosaccharide--protein glycosyltransferase